MTYRHDPPILSHAKYRFTCDHCTWQTDSYELLSQAARALAAHNRAHDPIKSDTPPPIKPSQVLDNLRKIR